MRIVLGLFTAPAKLYGVPIRLVVVVAFGVCAPLLGGWFAQSSGNSDLFERCGSLAAAASSSPRVGTFNMASSKFSVARGWRANVGDGRAARRRSGLALSAFYLGLGGNG